MASETADRSTTEAEPYREVIPADGDLGNITPVFRQLSAEDQPLAAYLVSETDTVRYILGAPGGDPELLERVCRRLLPDSYALQPTTPPTDILDADTPDAAATLLGRPVRRQDWQTRLTPHHATTHDGEPGIVSPLGDLVDLLATTDATVVYQALVHPMESWHHQLENRRVALEVHEDTLGQQILHIFTSVPHPDDITPADSHQRRLDDLDAKDARHPFAVTARAIAVGPDAKNALSGFGGIFTPVDGEDYRLGCDHHTTEAAIEAAHARFVDETLATRSTLARWKRYLPLTSNASPRIVTDAATAPQFCLLDPESLTHVGARVSTHQPPEQTGRRRPSPDTLARYQTDGLTIGLPQTVDSTADDTPIAVPPALQALHILLVGRTGAGKSTGLIRAILDNFLATDGADIIVDHKGDGMPIEYLQAHYHKHGNLDDVYYIDCRELLPALSVFDVRRDVAAGLDRSAAVIDRVDHYIDILEQLIGRDQYQDAIRSTDLVRYLLRACFDPVHGEDAFSHQEFLETITRMQTTQEPPAVSDDDLATALQGVAATDHDSFQKVMHGVKTRVEEIVTDQRLTQIFNHVPHDDDPHFQFDELLDEDCVIILDTGGLRDQSQRVLTLTVLAELWAALRRRTQHDTDPPLVNLYLEEASDIAASEILRDLLAKGRGFNVSVTLATQFPGQLRDNQGTLEEVLNNVSTIVSGNVPDDRDLARRFATRDHDPADVATRLRALSRGEWLATLPAPFKADVPQPFQLESIPIPLGHPDSHQPLTGPTKRAFETELDAVRARATDTIALPFTTPATTDPDNETEDEDAEDEDEEPPSVVRTTLPRTQRFPDCIEHAPSRHAVRCTNCDNHCSPSIEGVKRAIQCCHSITDVDRDDVPTVAIDLKLSPEEIMASDYSSTQLAFLQVVHTAQHQRYTDLEYDLTRDSMVRLREYVDIDHDAIQELIDEGVLRKDADYPHTLFSVTADGRQTINEATREGLDHGDGHGDLGETSHHRMAVTLGQQFLAQQFVDNPESPATRTAAYYPIGENKRLDAAALDQNDDDVVALEAERINHDLRDAAPSDYDKMAACEPEEAIWVAMNRDGAHKIVEALHNPLDGNPRIEKTYSDWTNPRQFSITQPGFTQMYTLGTIQNRLD